MYIIYFLILNLLLLFWSFIDDTDETYGYFEPLHYLLFQKGMQTWEYNPEYAIRSYAFLFPFWILSSIALNLGISKLSLFYFIKGILGLFSAFAASSFIKSINEKISNRLAFITFLCMLFCPGIAYANLSFLPSAVTMSLLQLAIASMLRNNFLACVAWGSIAVLFTGWPFIGVMFLPFGIHMLNSLYFKSGITSVILFCMQSLFVVLVIATCSGIIDVYMYNRWTFPSLNIAIYNAGNNNDNLYGIEPLSYYLKNMILNLGLFFPIALTYPLYQIIKRFIPYNSNPTTSSNQLDKLSMFISLIIWLGILFTRPHKEERFLYPSYPLICFFAADSLCQVFDILQYYEDEAQYSNTTDMSIITSTSHESITSQIDDISSNQQLEGKLIRRRRPISTQVSQESNHNHYERDNDNSWLFIRISLSLAFLLLTLLSFSGRMVSNYMNYHGYITLWKMSGEYITSNDSNPNITICTGSEWYHFPSHFFLPLNSRLEYISDGFHGQLPQHYNSINGTFIIPTQPFNTENKEEISRYIPLNSCNYLIKLEDDNHINKEYNEFEEIRSTKVLYSEKSTSSLARAYYIPYYSHIHNKFKRYRFLKRK